MVRNEENWLHTIFRYQWTLIVIVTHSYKLELNLSLQCSICSQWLFLFRRYSVIGDCKERFKSEDTWLNINHQNMYQIGRSLLYVFLYGCCFILIYSLISFAGFRSIYTSSTGLYCETMYQCLVTTLHRGLILTTLEVKQIEVKAVWTN